MSKRKTKNKVEGKRSRLLIRSDRFPVFRSRATAAWLPLLFLPACSFASPLTQLARGKVFYTTLGLARERGHGSLLISVLTRWTYISWLRACNSMPVTLCIFTLVCVSAYTQVFLKDTLHSTVKHGGPACKAAYYRSYRLRNVFECEIQNVGKRKERKRRLAQSACSTVNLC